MGSRAPLLILWPGPTAAPPTAAAAITARLTEALPGARVKILMAPWDDFHALESLLKTAREQPVVVAAPTGQVPPRRVLDRAIDAGLNPAAVQVVDPWLGLGTDPWSLLGAPAVAARGLALIEAAACRAIAQADAPKAALGLRLPSFAEPATRRDLWRALRPQVEVNPWINPVRCRAAGERSLCAAACPTGAIAHATAAGEAVAAQVASLLRRAEPQGPGPVVVYACPTALTALIRRHPGHGLLQGNAVPFGRVAVDPSRCTLCGLCTSVCPTAALSLAGGAEPRLLIEPTGCADCTACASICPEQAMQVQPGLDLDEAQDPARVLVSDRAVHCQGCGQPYAPAALVAKIKLSLTREAGGTGLQHLQYCPACRVAALSGARSDPHGST